jgi:general secretion pathway protein K
MALVVVLWILTFLGVIFTTFMFSMRTELAAAGNFKEEAEAYYIAEAGIYRAAAEIINADRNNPPNSSGYDALDESWHTNPDAYENVALGRGRYWVKVTDEESKVPLNAANERMLWWLFSTSGVKNGARLKVIVDSIMDWRDTDKLHRLNGAEDDYYLTLPVPYKAKNGNFETVDELLLVKGITQEILYGNITNPERRAVLEEQSPWERRLEPGEYLGVARHLSVVGAGQVNINTAGPEVLRALGLKGAEIQLILARRKEKPFAHVGEVTNLLTSIAGGVQQGFELVPGDEPPPGEPQPVLAVLGQAATVVSKHFSVESVAAVTGSRRAVRVIGLLQKDGSPGRPKLSVRMWEVDPREGA